MEDPGRFDGFLAARLGEAGGNVAMLDCGHVLAELSNYLDGEISPELKDALEKHLRKCHRCSLVYNTTRQTLRVVSESGAIEIPMSAGGRLRARLQELLIGN